MKTVKHYALNDISEYLREEGVNTFYDKNNDIWNVGVSFLTNNTKGYMNRDLNIHSLNKHKGNMNRYKKK